jgi:hypothetical protein
MHSTPTPIAGARLGVLSTLFVHSTPRLGFRAGSGASCTILSVRWRDCGGSGQHRHLGAADRRRGGPRRDRLPRARRRDSPPVSRRLSRRACASDSGGEGPRGRPRLWRERGAESPFGGRALAIASGTGGCGRCHGDREESGKPAGHKTPPRHRAPRKPDQVDLRHTGDQPRQDDLRSRRRRPPPRRGGVGTGPRPSARHRPPAPPGDRSGAHAGRIGVHPGVAGRRERHRL